MNILFTVVATGRAIYGAIHGISAIVPLVGLSALKTFAIGALAFNQFAFITAPILGITMDGIEIVSDGDMSRNCKKVDWMFTK